MVDQKLFTLNSIYTPLLLLFIISALQTVTLFTHGPTSILYCIFTVMIGISVVWLYRNLRINKKL